MLSFSNISRKLIGMSALYLLAMGCNKPDEVQLANEGEIYMPQAAGTRSKLELRLADTAQPIVFGAAVGGLKYPESSITVNFALDSGLLADYNQKNGTSYLLLPANSYVVSGLTSVIEAGKTSSAPLTIGIFSNRLAANRKYQMPISISSVSAGNVNPTLKTAYFAVDTIVRKSIDVTAQGTLTVNTENPSGPTAGEGSLKVVDGDLATKYLFFNYTPNTSWMQLQFPAPVAIGAYTLTSANDAATRDPKNWRLMGSNDGNTWVEVDSRTNEFFAGRAQTRRFEVGGIPQAYSRYRFHIDQNNGATLFQLAEWRMIRYE